MLGRGKSKMALRVAIRIDLEDVCVGVGAYTECLIPMLRPPCISSFLVLSYRLNPLHEHGY